MHIPFCAHKCHYCDFNSHVRGTPDWLGYGDALTKELATRISSPPFRGRRIDTIFFGGGTPSLAPPELIASFIETAESLAGIAADAEITMEANPGSADAKNFSNYHAAGINRLSIGVQSLSANELKWLERIHNPDQAIDAFHIARQSGVDNINLDLMFGLPDQSLDGWMKSLNDAIALAPEHISCYQLTVEPHTKLAATHEKIPYRLPDEQISLTMFTETRKRLCEAGYQPYEISNFAKPGRRCRHNDGYWLYHDYIGIGAGAAGKWDHPDGGITRYSNIRTPERYIEAALAGSDCANSSESMNQHEAAAEACWLGLRRSNGIDRNRFYHRFEADVWQLFRSRLHPWLQSGHLMLDEERLRLSSQGLPLTDTIAAAALG